MADEQAAQAAAPAKSNFVGETTKLFADEQFRNLNSDKQYDFLKRYLAKKAPEYSKLAPDRQDAFAQRVYMHYTRAQADVQPEPEQPGILSRLGSAIKEGGADILRHPQHLIPGEPGLERGASEQSMADVSPVTGALTRMAVGATSGPGGLANLLGIATPEQKAQMDKQVTDLLDSHTGRMAAEGARDFAQTMGAMYLGGKIGGAIADSVLPTGATKAFETAMEGGAKVTPDMAARAVSEKFRNTLVKGGSQILGFGELSGAAHALESEHPDYMGDFVYNPVAMLALGGVLVGGAKLLERGFSARAAQTADALAKGQAPGSELLRDHPLLKDANPWAEKFAKTAKMDPGLAKLVAYDAARKPLPRSVASQVLDAMRQDPELASSPFGLHVLRMQQGALNPVVRYSESGGHTVEFEDTRTGERFTTMPTSAIEHDINLANLRDGNYRVLSIGGNKEQLSRYSQYTQSMTPPPVATGEELDTFGFPAGADTKTPYDPSKPPESMTPAESMAFSLMRPGVEGKTPLLTDQRTSLPRVIEVPPTGPEQIGLTREQREARVAERHPGTPTEQPAFVSAFDPTGARGGEEMPAMPKPGTRLPSGGVVLANGDVHGPTVEFPNGRTTIKRFADGSTEAPPEVGRAPMTGMDKALAEKAIGEAEARGDKDAAAMIRQSLEGGAQAGRNELVEAIKRAQTALGVDKDGDLIQVENEGATGTALVRNLTTGATHRRDFVSTVKAIANGTLVERPTEFAKAPNEALVVANEKLNAELLAHEDLVDAILKRSMLTGKMSDRDMLVLGKHELLQERVHALVSEWQRRNGTLGQDIPITHAEMHRAFKSNFATIRDKVTRILRSEKGEIELKPGATLLPKDDMLSMNARIVGGKLWRSGDGFVLEMGSGKDRMLLPYADRNAVFAGIDAIMQGRLAETRAKMAALRMIRTDKVPPVPLDPTLETFVADPVLKAIGGPAPLDDPHAYLDGKWRPAYRMLMTAQRALRTQGPAGNWVADSLDKYQEIVNRVNGYAAPRFKLALDAIGKDWDKLYDRVEQKADFGPEVNAKLDAAHKEILEAFDFVYNEYKHTPGVDKVAPKIADYLPHVFNWSMIAKGQTGLYEKEIERVISKGIASTRDEAIEYLDRSGMGLPRQKIVEQLAARYKVGLNEAEKLLDRQREFNVGDPKGTHLEFDRLGVGGYVKDPRVALPAALMRSAKKLAQVRVFGEQNVELDKVLESFADQRARDFAVEQVNLHLGLQRPEESYFPALDQAQGLMLTYSTIPHITQWSNTLMKTNVSAFAKGLWSMMKHPREGLNNAHEMGAFASQMMYEFRPSAIRALDEIAAPESRLRGAYREVTRLPSKPLEALLAIHKSIAQSAGEYWFRQIADELRTTDGPVPRSSSLWWKLKELRMDPEEVRAAIKSPNPKDLQGYEWLAGIRVSSAAQLEGGFRNMPAINNAALGRTFLALKGWAVRQARFMFDQLSPSRVGPQKAARNWAMFLTMQPLLGYQTSKILQAFDPGRKIDSLQALAKFTDNPSVGGALKTYLLMVAHSTGFGFVSELAGSVVSEIGSTQRGFSKVFDPPMASTLTNIAYGVPQLMYGLATGDERTAAKGGRKVLHQFGGLGAAIQHNFLPDPNKRDSGWDNRR